MFFSEINEEHNEKPEERTQADINIKCRNSAFLFLDLSSDILFVGPRKHLTLPEKRDQKTSSVTRMHKVIFANKDLA